MAPLVRFCNGIFTVPAIRRARKRPNKRGRTSIRFPTRFISKIYGTPAVLYIWLFEAPRLPHTQPHPPNPHHVTEMVAIAVGDCQLNTSRRILAEIQLRINGFNTYG
ncbi:hypothetical protein SNOG_05426 [Parastagonospora nodorum SN15]|uniref:Uncharacterized protein n=1 Tax=Phaeosphaeria nodorum (strain SN15 / ATCC MYA-4574 / FGSC 10173) TaxID=321614 RepID=Q0US38_PHANO|nr:hypothetical protein SNOG_05426 [Parastagonospora nodorum SN15]EAT87817.1 hypothetical protein SNOG_05426 [Parastagonospora nodorum SN15]